MREEGRGLKISSRLSIQGLIVSRWDSVIVPMIKFPSPSQSLNLVLFIQSHVCIRNKSPVFLQKQIVSQLELAVH